jgi:hypothetical protein
VNRSPKCSSAALFQYPENKPRRITLAARYNRQPLATVYAYTFARAVAAYVLKTDGRYATCADIIDTYTEVAP